MRCERKSLYCEQQTDISDQKSPGGFGSKPTELSVKQRLSLSVYIHEAQRGSETGPI